MNISSRAFSTTISISSANRLALNLVSMRHLNYQLSFLLLLSCLLVFLNAAVLGMPVVPLNLTNFNISSFLDLPPDQNTSHVSTIQPSKFSTNTYFGTLALPTYPTLMTAVDAMVQIALLDWESQTGPKKFQIPIARYAQIEIFIGPMDRRPDATMHNGFAALGLFDLMVKILSDPDYKCRSAQSIFLYDGREVGMLILRMKYASSVASAAEEYTANSSIASSIEPQRDSQTPDHAGVGDIHDLSAPAWLDRRLKVSISRGVNELNLYEVFFGVYLLLLKSARQPINSLVPEVGFVLNRPPITTAGQPIAISFHGVGRTAANPPYFQWKWMIKAVAQLPYSMIEERNFRELGRIRLRVHDIEVGVGQIVRLRRGLDSS